MRRHVMTVALVAYVLACGWLLAVTGPPTWRAFRATWDRPVARPAPAARVPRARLAGSGWLGMKLPGDEAGWL